MQGFFCHSLVEGYHTGGTGHKSSGQIGELVDVSGVHTKCRILLRFKCLFVVFVMIQCLFVLFDF